MIILLKITRNITAGLSLVRLVSWEVRSCVCCLSPSPPWPTSSRGVSAASCCSSCCSSSASPSPWGSHCGPAPPVASCTDASRPWCSREIRPRTYSGRPHLPALQLARFSYQGAGGHYLSQDLSPHQEWCRTKISAISPLPSRPTPIKPSKKKAKSSWSFILCMSCQAKAKWRLLGLDSLRPFL